METVLTEEEKLLHRMFRENEIEKLFQEDPFYKKVKAMDLTGALFEMSNEHSILDIDFSRNYSTKEVAELLGKANQEYQLNNLLAREDLGGYFQVSRIGTANHCRYDWKAICRFKLVFLLMGEANLKPSNLAAIIKESGILKELVEEMEPDPLLEEVNQLKEKLEILEKQIRQLKYVLGEERKAPQQTAKRIEEEVVLKEARFLEQFRAFLNSHYEHQLLFFEQLEECVAEEVALQQKDKSIFGRREKTKSSLSSLQKIQGIFKAEQNFLQEERDVNLRVKEWTGR